MIACQISFYPMGTEAVSARVKDAIEIIGSYPLDVKIGPLSTAVSGETDVIYEMLGDLTNRMETAGLHFVMTITVSNACPWR